MSVNVQKIYLTNDQVKQFSRRFNIQNDNGGSYISWDVNRLDLLPSDLAKILSGQATSGPVSQPKGTTLERPSTAQGTQQTANTPKSHTVFQVGNGQGMMSQDLADYLASQNGGQVLVKVGDEYRLAEGKRQSDVSAAINRYNQGQPQTFNLPKVLYDKLSSELQQKLVAVAGKNDTYTVKAEDAQSVHDALTQIQGCKPEAAIQEQNAQVTYNFNQVTPAYEETVVDRTAYLSREQIQAARLQTKEGRRDFQAVVRENENGGLKKWMQENQVAADYTAVRMQHGRKIDRKTDNLVKEYQKTYKTEDEQLKAAFGDYMKLLKDGSKIKDELLKALGENPDAAKIKAILGVDLEELCSMVVTQEYLNGRTEKQLAKLRSEFVDDMSERIVDEYRDQEVFNNTVPCFSAKAQKDAEANRSDGNQIYTDIGDYGRKLVEKYPELFCDVVANGGDFDVDGIHYKFNPQNYKKFCAELAYAAHNDGMFTEQYMKDHFLTLDESRQAILKKGLFEDGGTIEDILHTGKGANDRVNYRENRRFRRLMEAAGINIEKDSTHWKRAGYIAATTAGGAALGAGVGAFITHTGADQVLQDGMEKFVEHVEGAAGGYDNIFYKRIYKTIAGKTANFLVQGGIGGTIAGLGLGFFTKNKIMANGTRFDHVINLEGSTRTVNHEAVNGVSQTLNVDPPKVQNYTYTYQEQQTIPNYTWRATARNINRNYNEADSKFDAVRQAYGLQNADQATQQAVYDAVMAHNNLGKYKNPTQYTTDMKYYFPGSIEVNGTTYNIQDNLISNGALKFPKLEQVQIQLARVKVRGKKGSAKQTTTTTTQSAGANRRGYF